MNDQLGDGTNRGVVLSLCDHTGNMVRPWARAGYECICVDIKNDGKDEERVGDGIIYFVEADIKEYLPPRTDFEVAFAFPPCTNLAVSGARWFEQKGIDGLASGLELVERSKRLLEWTGAPWMLENPVSTISSYWRDPDHTFHPFEFAPYTERDEEYRKKTCLWTGGGFEMPDPHPEAPADGDDRIHKMPPSDDRSEVRSETPMGFANAVFESNHVQDAQRGSHGDNTHVQNAEPITLPEGVKNRDSVWIAVVDAFQNTSRIELSDVIDDVEASRTTVHDVLTSMNQAGLVNHEDGSRYWERSAALSRVMGHPTPTGGAFN